MIPKALYLKLGAAGFLCVDAPEEYGGAGAPLEFSFAIAEESARLGYMSLTSNLMMHSDIVAPYILHLGSEEQKRKDLPQMISSERAEESRVGERCLSTCRNRGSRQT